MEVSQTVRGRLGRVGAVGAGGRGREGERDGEVSLRWIIMVPFRAVFRLGNGC